MPQSIYQGWTPQQPKPPSGYGAAVPVGLAYIGETVQDGTAAGGWRKAPVWNMVGNNWIMLNADLDKVDYVLRDLTYNSTVLEIFDHLNWDFLDYALTITPAPSGWTNPGKLPDNYSYGTIKGLTQATKYTFDLRANLAQGGTTGPSVQSITTPANPIPSAPINLTSPSRSNSWIDLAWTDPAGSTAVKWRVYVGVQGKPAAKWGGDLTTRKVRVTGRAEDQKYHYRVTGVNAQGQEGPASNILQWATGHDAKRRTGSIHRAPLNPVETGAWRPDIGWYDWHELWYNNRKILLNHLYQGYWQKDPIWTGSTAGIDRPEQESGRYRGVVTYDAGDFRRRMDATYGAGVWKRWGVSCVEIRRVYRHAGVGTVNGVWIEWFLTNTNVYDSSNPPIYFGHRNTTNSPDAVAAQDTMKAGQTIEFLRLPRGYGDALVTGTGWYSAGNGVAVNGIMIYQGGHVNTGAGAAGYGRWSGQGSRDPLYPSDASRFSDWTILITASWNFEYIPYKAPYQW